MSRDQGETPLPLDYQASSKTRFWPEDPFAPSRVIGFLVGFMLPFGGFIWDTWTESIIRVPLLWYQHEWWIAVAAVLVVALICMFLRTKFVYGLLFGAGVAFVILGINRWINVMYFGVNPLDRLTGYRIW